MLSNDWKLRWLPLFFGGYDVGSVFISGEWCWLPLAISYGGLTDFVSVGVCSMVIVSVVTLDAVISRVGA